MEGLRERLEAAGDLEGSKKVEQAIAHRLEEIKRAEQSARLVEVDRSKLPDGLKELVDDDDIGCNVERSECVSRAIPLVTEQVSAIDASRHLNVSLHEPPEVCLINCHTGKPYIFVEDGPDNGLVTLVDPDGVKRNGLKRTAFGEPQDVDMKDLTEEQRAWCDRQNAAEAENAIRTLRKHHGGGVIYLATRLTFVRSIIEPLMPHEEFTIVCNDGEFTMTKAQFEDVFSNVANSMSYNNGSYNYKKTPEKAMQFRNE
jgi:hypothetical protein